MANEDKLKKSGLHIVIKKEASHILKHTWKTTEWKIKRWSLSNITCSPMIKADRLHESKCKHILVTVDLAGLYFGKPQLP